MAALAGFSIGSGSGSPSPAAPAAPSGGGGALAGFKIGAQTAAPNVSATPAATSAPSITSPAVSTTTPATPAPVTPKSTGGMFSGVMNFAKNTLSNASNAISKATTEPTQSQLPDGGKSAALNTVAYLPSELAREIPGVADLQDDSATQNGLSDLTAKDEVSAVGTTAGETAAGLAKVPLKAAADVYDAGRVFLGKNPDASFNVPVLGKVTSDVYDASDAIANGMDPVQAILQTGSSAIFNTLFFADLINRVAGPRAVTTSKVNAELPDGVTADAPKTGRLYQTPTAYNKGGAQVLTPDALDQMKSQGVVLGSKFDPKAPTFFRVTAGKGGAYTGEIVQLKPSYLKTAYNSLFGTKEGPTSVPAMLGMPESNGVPATGASQTELATLAEKAAPADVTTLHSATVNASDVVGAIRSGVQNAPEPKVPSIQKPVAPIEKPSMAETVMHNTLRLGGGDTSRAKEGSAILQKDIAEHLANEGEPLTHVALQEKLGVDAPTAQKLINEAKPEPELPVQTKALQGYDLGSSTGKPSNMSDANILPETGTSLPSLSSKIETPSVDSSIRYTSPSYVNVLDRTGAADDITKYSSTAIAHGKENLEPFKQDIEQITGVTPEVQVKSPGSIAEKGARLQEAGKPLARMNDVLRSRITVPEDERQSMLDKITAHFNVLGTGDYRTKESPYGYRGINVTVKLPNGMPAEIQIHSPESLAHTNFIHPTYEKYRNEDVTKMTPERLAEHEKDAQMMRSFKTSETALPAPLSARHIPVRGFINPGAIADDIVAVTKQVGDYIEKQERSTKLTDNVNDSIYQHEGLRKANRQRAIQLLQTQGNLLTAEQWENLYHYDENSKGETLTPQEQEVYDHVIAPLKKALTDARAEYRSLGGTITSDLQQETTPRYAKEKGGPIDSLLANAKAIAKGDKSIANGGLMSKSVASGAKHRTFHIAEDEEGKRTVVHIPTGKNAKVTAFNNNVLSDLGTINSQTRESLLKEEIKPLQKKLRSTQKLIDTLESIRTRDPISSRKLSTLEARIAGLKEYAAERAAKVGPVKKVQTTISREIDKTNATMVKLEGQLKALKPFGNVPKVSKAIDTLQHDIDAAYEHESNLALSDIYENLSEFVDRNDATNAQVIKDLAKTTSEFKTLSKVPKGTEVVLTKNRIKNAIDAMRKLTNEMAEIEEKYNPESLNERVFKGADKKAYTIGQATTKEIEANSNTRYHKNPLANYVLAYDRTSNALSALKLLKDLQENPAFKDLIVKQDTDEAPPQGWKDLSGIMPQFRGYYADPKLAEALEDLAKRLTGRDPIPVFDEINNFLVTSIVLNPILHVPNVAVGWATSESANASIPGISKNSAANFAKAVNEVKNKGPLYLSYIESGAPFMALKQTSKEFTEAVLTQYSNEVAENPTEHEAIAKALGYANPLAWMKGFSHINEAITWGSNDILFMHALLDHADRTGVTAEEAIKQVSKRMADYRLPSRIGPGKFGRAVSKLVQSPAFLFSRYHYSGVIKPWIEGIKDTAGPKSTFKQRREGLRALAYLALMSLIVYPYIDKAIQGMTGNKNSYITQAGATKLPQTIAKLYGAGATGIPAAINSTLALSPALYAADELGFNTDLYTRNPIYSSPMTAQDEGLDTFGVSMVAPLATATRMKPSDFALSLLGIYSPANAPGKNALDAQKYDELPALEVQVKKDEAAGLTNKANAEIKDFNDRAITNYNADMLAQDKPPLAADGSENDAFLKQWGIKAPGAISMANASKLYGDGSLTSKATLLQSVGTYAKAIGTDPVTAFNRIFTGQLIVRVDNAGILSPDSAIIVQRAPLATTEAIRQSEASANGESSQLGGLQLDHFIPLEAGGSNDSSNLDLVTTEQNEVLHTPVESAIAAALKNGQISRANAEEYLVRFKIGTLHENPNQKYVDLYKNQYGSQPITLDQINALIKSGKAK